MKTATERISIAEIVDPMLKAKKPREEIICAIRKARPDFKSPSAGIANRVRALGAPAPAGGARKARAASGKMSAGDVAEPMLLEGTHMRAEIMAAIAKARPDFKDPSAAVSNRFRDLVAQGKHPGLVEVDRPRRAKGKAGETPAATLAKRREQRLARLDKWAKETTDEVESNFAKLRKFQTDVAAQPKARKVLA